MITFEQLPNKVEQLESKLDNALELLSKLIPQQTKKRLSIKEASVLTGYAVNTIYGKIHRDEIPYKKIGGKVFFDSEELERWIDNGE